MFSKELFFFLVGGVGLMGSIKRKGLGIVPVVKGFDCMHDERLNRRLRRRNIGTQSFKVNLNGKGNICKDIMALKSSHESVCIQKDGPDSHFHCEDYVKFYDDLVRGLFVDIDACLDFNSSSSQQRYSGGKCIESPTNAPKTSSYIILDDDDNIEVDEHSKKFLKDLDEGLYVDSDCDACVDIKTSLSKKRNGDRLTDKGDVNVDLVNELVENNIGGNGAVYGVDLDTRSIDGDATPFSLADGFASLGKVDVGRDNARVGDNDIVDDGHLNNGIVGEEAGDDGNSADDGSLGDGADNDEDPDS